MRVRATMLWLAASLGAGCFGPSGDAAIRDGGAGDAASVGPRECGIAGDCRLVDERCCPCGPPVLGDGIRAVPRTSEDFGVHCLADCGECPAAQPIPITVVADCVDGRCEAVDLREQPYAACEVDSECTLQAPSCCGFCGTVTAANSYAFNHNSDYQPCSASHVCPDIGCPALHLTVTPACSAAGVCEAHTTEFSLRD